MKDIIIILTALLLIIGGIAIYKQNQVSDLKADLKHLNNTIDIRIHKSIIDAEKRTTDSLLNEFNNQPAHTIIKTQIQIRYETIIDSIFVLPDSTKVQYITTELDRLYPN
jgi:predicted Holliday junction resolvase-like endonuclease